MTTYAQQIAAAAIEAAAKACESEPVVSLQGFYDYDNGERTLSNAADSIRALNLDAIVASVPRKLDPELKAALEQAEKAGDLHAVLPNGSVMFINRGEQPEDTADLDCPYCGGSGHKDDVRDALTQARELTDAEIDQIADEGHRNKLGGIYATSVHAFARALLSANQGK